ncbi:MAG: DUF3368 domain-containing protein [Thermomicrobiales bacterium]
MTRRPVVADASLFIALERIRRLDLISAVLKQLVIPPAVHREIGPVLARSSAPTVQALSLPLDSRIVAADLGPGESEAIQLAIELRAVRVILDDGDARLLARSLGVPLIGTVGVLLSAKDQGAIPALKPLIDAKPGRDQCVDQRLYRSILDEAGE